MVYFYPVRGYHLILVMLFATFSGFSQNEANWWYFGYKCGIDFNQTPPVAHNNGGLNTLEGCSGFSNKTTGALMLYTDGQSVWDRNHNVMTNGTGLLGSQSSSQSGLVIPQPGSTTKFWLFTVPTNTRTGLRYSEIDMSLRSGLGDVVSTRKNDTLGNFNVSDRLTAVQHRNGRDYWVFVQDDVNWDIVAFLITSTGVSHNPVRSSVTRPTGVTGTAGHLGCMKSSPDGSKFATATFRHSFVGLFNLNNATGRLSGQITIHNPSYLRFAPYGVEFSPNSNVLYVDGQHVYQYNVSTMTSTNVINSEIKIDSSKSVWGQLQLAPDLKIYQSRMSSTHLGRINDPDNLGHACNFVDTGFAIKTGSTIRLGLPAFLQSIFNTTTLEVSISCVNYQTVISVKDTGVVDSVRYDYGDPASGASNTSWNKLDSHIFRTPGKYPVTAFAFYTDPNTSKVVRDTLIDTVEVLAPPRIWLGNDTTICDADSIYITRLDTMPSTFYWWDSTKKASHMIDSAGIYWAMAVNRCGIGRDTISIDSLFTDTLNLGPDTFICQGDILVLDISDTNATYLWNNGSTSPIQKIVAADRYTAQVSNVCGIRKDSINVKVEIVPTSVMNNDAEICLTNPNLRLNPPAPRNTTTNWKNRWTSTAFGYSVFIYQLPVTKAGTYYFLSSNACGAIYDTVNVVGALPFKPDLGPDTVICDQRRLFLDPNTYGSDVSWSNGWTDSAIYVSTAGTYIVTAKNACGSFKDTIEIETFDSPKLELPGDTMICSTDTLNINAVGGNVDYKWSHGPTTPGVSITQAGTYSLTISNGCGTATDQIKVDTVRPLSPYLGKDTIICSNIPLVLYPYTGRYSDILWSTGERGDSISITAAGDYQVRLYNLCGSYTDEITIGTESPPQVDLGEDTVICHGEVLILTPGLENEELTESNVVWQDRIESSFFKVKREGNYRVEASNRCGSTKDTVYIAQQARVDGGVFYDTVVCRKQLVYDLSRLPYRIEWQDGSTKKRYTIADAGDYSFTMIDEVGCAGSEYFSVKECSSELYAPTGFTPNNNAINEGFRVYKTEIYDFHIIIVNRWNQIVFESNEITEEWYGTNQKNGTKCPIGVYLWKVSFKEIQNDQEQVVIGEVNIIR